MLLLLPSEGIEFFNKDKSMSFLVLIVKLMTLRKSYSILVLQLYLFPSQVLYSFLIFPMVLSNFKYIFNRHTFSYEEENLVPKRK